MSPKFMYQNNLSIQQKLITLYVLLLFVAFPLYSGSARIQHLTLKGILFCIVTVAMAAVYIVLLLQKRLTYRKHFYRLDICMLLALAFSIWKICGQAIQGRSGYELYLLISLVVLSYFMMTSSENGIGGLLKSSFLDLFLVACGISYLEMLVHFFLFPDFRGSIGLLLENKTDMRAFLVLSSAITVLQYCTNRKPLKDKMYLIIGIVGFLLLFLQRDIIAVLLISVLFLLIPILFLPTAELVRRDLLMAFLFFFLLSNMPLLANYTDWVKIELQFNLVNSIYLDLLIAFVGMLAFFYWDRIPKGISWDYVVMRKVQKVFIFVSKLCGILMAAVVLSGSIGGMEERVGFDMLKRLGNSLRESIMQTRGTFGQAFWEYGLPGFLLTGVIFALMIARLRRNYECTVYSARLTIIAIMFMAQSLFYEQQIMTTPIYAVLVIFALFQYNQKEENDEKMQEHKMDKIAANDGDGNSVMGQYGLCQPDEASGGAD